MTKDPQEVILCVLGKIKYQVDLAPKNKLDIKKILAEDKKEGIARSIRSIMMSYYNLGIRLMVSEVRDKCGINFYEFENVLGKLKEAKVIYGFIPVTKLGYFQILPSPKFNEIYQTIQEINKNPWLSETGRFARIKKLLEGKRKQSEEKIDYEKPEQDAKTRAEEIKRQLEELDERQKAFKELGRQISSRIQKDFDVKQYGEVIKKIDEQAEPIRRALKQLDAVYSGSVQNSLIPVLQRLTESIKPIREQMERLKPLFEYPEYPKEAFISSDVIRARQGAETISKLEDIEVLIQNLLTEKSEKETIKETEKSKLKTSDKWLVFFTKDGVELKFNKENGDVKFGKVEGNLAPETQEYKVFLCLLKSPSYITKYVILLKEMYPNEEFKEPLSKHQVARWGLDTVMRNTKIKLGILPRKEAKNKTIFQTLKKAKAYRLKLETK